MNTYNEGEIFVYKNKEYIIRSIGHNSVNASPVIKSPMALMLSDKQFTEITGGKLNLKSLEEVETKLKDKELIRKLESIKYRGGTNAKQEYDKYISDGYDKVVSHKIGAVTKYFIKNDKTNSEIPVSGITRTYVEKLLATK